MLQGQTRIFLRVNSTWIRHPVLGNRDRWPAAGRGPEATGALPHARHVHPLHPHPQYHPGPGDSIMI